jgi:hypothetical protein
MSNGEPEIDFPKIGGPAHHQVAVDAANRAGGGFTPERQFHMHSIRSDHIALWFKKLEFTGLSVFRRSV